MAKLTKKEKEAAIRFLSLIECAVASRGMPDDSDCVEMDNAEIEGFNACAKMLGVVGYRQ
jgi:hypothetical protein